MKFCTILISCLIIVNIATAQDSTDVADSTNWKKGGSASLLFNQIAFSNWAKGGENSVTASSFLNLHANYTTEMIVWENSLQLGYGFQYSDEYDFRKTEDKIDLSSKAGYKIANPNIYAAFLVNFNTQFDDGYNYPDDSTLVSTFMAPAYLKISLGIDYKPKDYLSFYISPATGQLVFVNNQQLADKGAFGVEPGDKLDVQFGAYFRAKIEKDIAENVNLNSKLELFNNYTDDREDNRANIDVDWQTSLAMKINSYLSANIFVHVIYDHDIPVPIYETIDGVETKVASGPRTQVKEVFGIGFSYIF